MKKVITIALAVIMAFTLATGAFANTASADMRELVYELAEAVGGANVLAALVADFLDGADIDINDEIPEDAAEELMALLVEAMAGNDEDGALAEAASGLMSNDFINFIAGLYIPNICDTTEVPAPPTGDSRVIAVGAMAAVAVAAAAAFVCLKKKEK